MTDDLTTLVQSRIPLARAMEVNIQQIDGWVRTKAPLTPNQNHMGTAFAGSLGAICMLTGWAQVLVTLGVEFTGDIVLKSAELRYLRPLASAIEAQVLPLDSDAMSHFLSGFANHGKADLKLKVKVRGDSKSAVAFRGTYTALALE